jgi:hypothetical protein
VRPPNREAAEGVEGEEGGTFPPAHRKGSKALQLDGDKDAFLSFLPWSHSIIYSIPSLSLS